MKRQRISLVQKVIRSKAFVLLCIFIGISILFSVMTPFLKKNVFFIFTIKAPFINMNMIKYIMNDLTIPAFLAIGAGCLMVSGAIDLSQARVGAVAGIILACGISPEFWGLPWYWALIIALVVAGILGLINSLLVNEMNFAPFIATMAMSSIIYAIMYLVATKVTVASDGSRSTQMLASVNFTNKTLEDLVGYQITSWLPATVVVIVVLFLIYGIILSKTKFGRKIYLIGGNATAARLAGINSKRLSYFLFINCSVLSGLAGVIYSARTKQGTLLQMANDQFTGMTAAILGGISFGGGSGGMGGAFVGLLVIKTVSRLTTTLNLSSYYATMVSGALLILALAIDYISQRRQRARVGI